MHRGYLIPLFLILSLTPQLNAYGFGRARCSEIFAVSRAKLEKKIYMKWIPPVFKELYGPMAGPAAELLWENAGPVFATDAMMRAYREIWAQKGPLSLKERSLATVSALVALKLSPQIRLHINGFLSQGGTLEELYSLSRLVADPSNIQDLTLALSAGLEWRASSISGFQAPTRVEVKQSLEKEGQPSALSPQLRRLALLSRAFALGDMGEFKGLLTEVKADSSIAVKDSYVDMLSTHLIVYCGYPRGMNASTAWQEVRE